jgi:hypothetical protein
VFCRVLIKLFPLVATGTLRVVMCFIIARGQWVVGSG